MTPNALACDFDLLLDGPHRLVTVPAYGVVALTLLMFAWDLELRGCRWEFSDDGKLLVRPDALLTDADRSSLRANASAFRALARQWETVQ